jgi:hypothetical protein
MAEATRYTAENNAVDWLALADQLFPADALRPAPSIIPLALLRNGV